MKPKISSCATHTSTPAFHSQAQRAVSRHQENTAKPETILRKNHSRPPRAISRNCENSLLLQYGFGDLVINIVPSTDPNETSTSSAPNLVIDWEALTAPVLDTVTTLQVNAPVARAPSSALVLDPLSLDELAPYEVHEMMPTQKPSSSSGLLGALAFGTIKTDEHPDDTGSVCVH